MKRRTFIRVSGRTLCAALPIGSVGGVGPGFGRAAKSTRRRPAIRKRHPDDFSAMWWANGVRAKQLVFNVQAAHYGLAFDTNTLSFQRLGPVQPRAEATILAENNEVIEGLPMVTCTWSVSLNGQSVNLKSTGALADCQLIESGTYFQRRWLPKLNFDEAGLRVDPDESGLELAFWPRSFHMSLRLSSSDPIPETEFACQLRLATTRVRALKQGWAWCVDERDRAFLIRSENTTLTVENEHTIRFSRPRQSWPTGISEPIRLVFVFGEEAVWQANHPELRPETGLTVRATQLLPLRKDLPVTYDERVGWFLISLANDHKPEDLLNMAQPADEQTRIQVRNNQPFARTIALNCRKESRITGHTGISQVLCNSDQVPMGIPVQLSKNWHTSPKPNRFKGRWHNGIWMIYLQPGEELTVYHYLITSYTAGLPAVSMAQLCLVGWGHNQLWLESAIGSWGESLTFEPDQTHGRGLVLDARPLAVWGMGDKPNIKWNWTHNMGGADFLVYIDQNGKKQWPSQAKTQIRRYGPLLCEVACRSLTDDRKIALSYTLRLVGSTDYVRGLYSFRMEVLAAVQFSRFVIFQCGSDAYNYTAERKMAVGNETGLLREWNTQWGGNAYKTDPIPLTGTRPWVSLHEAVRLRNEEGSLANRGVVVRRFSARVGGQSVGLAVAERGMLTSGQNTSQVDFLLDTPVQSLRAGDVIEGEFEHLLIPQFARDYYGLNVAFWEALITGENTWQLIYREASQNAPTVTATGGQIISNWPIQIGFISNPLTVQLKGGLGHLPITVTGIATAEGVSVEEWTGSGWKPTNRSEQGSPAYQVDVSPATGDLEFTFLVVANPAGEADSRQQFRFWFLS